MLIELEMGKKMPEDVADVTVTFKHAAPCLCPASAGVSAGRPPGVHGRNVLRYKIQPDEGVTLSFWVKRPGTELAIEEKDFAFDYKRAYDPELFIDPYEKLLLDTLQGNQTLFVSTDEVKASWKFVDPIVRAWAKNVVPLVLYRPGTVPAASGEASGNP
jgi:glucose-6-phosphate 1-dehydrogenase